MKKSLAFVILSTIAAIGLVLCFGVSKSYCQEGLILPHADAGGAIWNVGQLEEWNQDFAPNEAGGFFDIFKAKTPVKLTDAKVNGWNPDLFWKLEGPDSIFFQDLRPGGTYYEGDDYAFMAKPRFWRLNRFKERLRGGNFDDGYAVNAQPNRVTQDGWEEDELGPVHLWIRPSFPINSFGFLI